MKKLADNVFNFLHNQGFAIVSTLDAKGSPHSACKGIVDIDKKGLVYLMDLYRGHTHENIKRNPAISITVVDEHRFAGYCLKGKGRIMNQGQISSHLIKAWDDKITSRITRRLLKNLHEEKGHPRHPEVLLPKPEYLIVVEIEEIVDLTPQHLK